MAMVIEKFSISNNSGESHVIVAQDPSLMKLEASRRFERQRHWVCQLLAESWGVDEVLLGHTHAGAPIITNHPEYFVSISHSGEYIAVQWSKFDKVGIDIQIYKTGLRKGSYYFVNEFEERLHEMNDNNLLVIWSAKEAVYKLKKGVVDRYKESISIIKITSDFVEVLVDGETVNCELKSNDAYILVYAV